MGKFLVEVEKKMYCTGKVFIPKGVAESEEEALEIVEQYLDLGVVELEDITWSEPQFEDFSFETTGAVDYVE